MFRNRQLLYAILENQEKIMSELTDLQAAVATLVTTVASEDSDINTAIAQGKAAASALNAQIAALQASGALPAGTLSALTTSINQVMAAMNTTDAAVKAAVANLPPVPPPAA
jgi:chromosome segregation ATPase